MNKIHDGHNHWMPPEVAEKTTFFKQGWSDIDSLLKNLDSANIEKAVLLYPTSDAHLNFGGWAKLCAVYNQALAEKVKEHPQRLIGAGIIPVDKPQEMLSVIERIKDSGLSCLSLASSYEGRYLDDEIFWPVLEKCARENLPIFVHAQIINPIGFERVKDPLLMPVAEYLFDITMSAGRLLMSKTFSRLPNLKIVFAHFAGVVPFLTDRFDSTYTMLRGRNYVQDLGDLPSRILKNAYVDTSGVKSKAMLDMALESFGADRIIFGTDFPAKRDLGESVKVVESLSLSPEDKDKVLGANLESLFNQGGK